MLLPNNVKGKPNLFETKLATPQDLPDEWDVALINILYPHNDTNLNKSYQYFQLRQPIENVNSKFAP